MLLCKIQKGRETTVTEDEELNGTCQRRNELHLFLKTIVERGEKGGREQRQLTISTEADIRNESTAGAVGDNSGVQDILIRTSYDEVKNVNRNL